MKKRTATLSSILILCLLTAGAALAGPAAEVSYSASGIHFGMNVHGGVTITVAGDDFHSSQRFGAGESPFISLTDDAGNALEPGLYKWSLTVDGKAVGERPMAGSRKPAITQSGNFRIAADGSLVNRDLVEGGLYKDQVILDDLIVNGGSACIGLDCNNGESFGSDTLRLKENNLRIHFQDTSTSASFPTSDWRIIANDSTNGGENYLAFEDSNAGTIPFRVEAGAGANSLFVEAGGNVGLGTDDPVVQLHVKNGNTPTLRLEQDGSSGFASQTWDVAGNEAGFFIRDATNGSKLSFRVLPNAPSEALVVEGTTGDIGIGAGTNPSFDLHVRRSAAAIAQLESTGSGAIQVRLKSDLENPRFLGENGSGVQSQILFDDAGTIRMVGESDTSGVCLQFRDSDDLGNSHCTLLDGVMTCATGDCP